MDTIPFLCIFLFPSSNVAISDATQVSHVQLEIKLHLLMSQDSYLVRKSFKMDQSSYRYLFTLLALFHFKIMLREK